MTDEAKQAIDILQKEILCVSGDCDTSRCHECDLMMPDSELIIKACKVAIKALEQEPKTGHWVIYDVHGHKACKCSECNKDVGYPCYDKYCGHCGSYNGGERI